MFSYLKIGAIVLAALAIAGLTAAMYKYHADAVVAQAAQHRAEADLEVAQGVIRTNQETIGRQKAQLELNDKLVAGLADDVDAIRKSQTGTEGEVGKLKDDNQGVRDLLKCIVPPDLERVLNK